MRQNQQIIFLINRINIMNHALVDAKLVNIEEIMKLIIVHHAKIIIYLILMKKIQLIALKHVHIIIIIISEIILVQKTINVLFMLVF